MLGARGPGPAVAGVSLIFRRAALRAATPRVIEFRRLRGATSGRGANETREADTGEGDAEMYSDDVQVDSAGFWRMPPDVPIGGAGQYLVFAGGSDASGGGLKCSRMADMVVELKGSSLLYFIESSPLRYFSQTFDDQHGTFLRADKATRSPCLPLHTSLSLPSSPFCPL